MNTAIEFDLGPLTWIKPEVDRALAATLEAIAAWDGREPAGLRAAAAHLHQATGAMQIVDLRGVALVCEAVEGILADLCAQPGGGQVPAAVGEALRAIRAYLDGLLDGRPNRELSLRGVYEDLAAVRGGDAPPPSALFFPDLDVRAERTEAVPELDERARLQHLRAARARYQKGLTMVLQGREVQAGVAHLEAALRAAERLAEGAGQHTFWWTAVGLTDFLRHDLVRRQGDPQDLWVKRLLGRLDLQFRRLLDGSRQLAEGLLRDVLYCMLEDSGPQGRSAEVHDLFALTSYRPEPASATAASAAAAEAAPALRDAVASTKEHWLRFCAGQADRLPPLRDAVARLAVGAAALPDLAMGPLVAAVQETAARLSGPAEVEQNEALQVEVAAALLLIEHAVEHRGRLGEDVAEQAAMAADRLRAAARGDGQAAPAVTAPLLDRLARQAQERLLQAQVAQEIQANLHQSEEILDRFFRTPAERSDLPMVPGLLKQIEGALAILQLDAAGDLVRAAQERIGRFVAAGGEVSAAELDWVAEALSSLGLYADALRVGRDDPTLLRGLPRAAVVQPDEVSVETGLAERTERARAAAAGLSDIPGEAAEEGRAQLRAELSRVASDADLVGDEALRGQAGAVLELLREGASPESIQAAVGALAAGAGTQASSGDTATPAIESDGDLLDVFLEEAKTVLAEIAVRLGRLRAASHDRESFVEVRRGFHTLKGSGRMVGLVDLGEVAWELEQCLNHWLRIEASPDEALLALIDDAATAFRRWVEEIEAQGAVEVASAGLVARARALRGEAEVGVPPAVSAAEAASEPQAGPAVTPDLTPEQVWVGGHCLSASLYTVFVEEAGQRLDELRAAAGRFHDAGGGVPGEACMRASHTLAGIARTTGFTPVGDLAGALETWTNAASRSGTPAEQAALLDHVTGALDAMLQSIRRREWPQPAAQWIERLREATAADGGAAAQTAASPATAEDAELLSIFIAEADELLPEIGAALRDWRSDPQAVEVRQALQRTLHTLKGSARVAGAGRLGDAIHEMESRVVAQAEGAPAAAVFDDFERRYDQLAEFVEALRHPLVPAEAASAVTQAEEQPAAVAAVDVAAGVRQGFRTHAELLDRLINEAGEVSIARARVQAVLKGFRQSAAELTDNVERLRGQLRELEIEAESQIGSRLAQRDEASFDPLEFDRYTRLQELTRLMAESVNDVVTAQDGLLDGLADAEQTLLQQARSSRNLQQQLMHIRMVRMSSQAERLHRIVRQAAKDAGRQARLHIEHGDIELDRSVLDRALVPFEHLLRNAVVHGIEPVEIRCGAGKPEVGEIRIVARQEGSEVVFTLSDDGAGIDRERIRRRAEALGWLDPGDQIGGERLEALLFEPGFSTADEVTQAAGRGVGLDVVRSEISAIGGRIRLDSTPGAGTRFTIRLPSSLALAQVVLVDAGDQTYALPAGMVVLVRETDAAAWQAMLDAAGVALEEDFYPLRSLAELTGQQPRPPEGMQRTVLLLRAGDERAALRVDALHGDAEVVVKPIGPQLARAPGVAGATLLTDGRVALILNPFALIERAPPSATRIAADPATPQRPPLVLVVDDSLTVRRSSERLLVREGYRVATAKDGMEALERLDEEVPAVLLLDIEMPRMDGFELARRVRGEVRTQHVPMVMITSRTADKHRQHALQLGVDVYMGKPYQEGELLAAVSGFAGRPVGDTGNQPVQSMTPK